MMRDRLSDYPGLTPHPKPGCDDFYALRNEIEFMLLDKGADASKAGRAIMARSLLLFMIGRRLWPLGTKCKVTKKLNVETVFPESIR